MATEHKDVTIEDIEKVMDLEQMEFVLTGSRRYVDAVSDLVTTSERVEDDTQRS